MGKYLSNRSEESMRLYTRTGWLRGDMIIIDRKSARSLMYAISTTTKHPQHNKVH
jgi:hypothetical protein